jgi:hypothetical protein
VFPRPNLHSLRACKTMLRVSCGLWMLFCKIQAPLGGVTKTSPSTFPIKAGERKGERMWSVTHLSLSTHISHIWLVTNTGNSDRFHSLKGSYDCLEERVRGCFLICLF